MEIFLYTYLSLILKFQILTLTAYLEIVVIKIGKVLFYVHNYQFLFYIIPRLELDNQNHEQQTLSKTESFGNTLTFQLYINTVCSHNVCSVRDTASSLFHSHLHSTTRKMFYDPGQVRLNPLPQLEVVAPSLFRLNPWKFSFRSFLPFVLCFLLSRFVCGI